MLQLITQFALHSPRGDSMFVTEAAIATALDKLCNTADSMLKVWFVLKQMGMTNNTSAVVTIASPQQALERLFSFGDRGGRFVVPFGKPSDTGDKHPQVLMENHASRSVIQTNVNNMMHGTIKIDPTDYLSFVQGSNGIMVRPTGQYPVGLGYGRNGFALEDDAKVSMSDVAFAVWYYRQLDIPAHGTPTDFRQALQHDLNLTPGEMSAIFYADDWTPDLQPTRLSDTDVHNVVEQWLRKGSRSARVQVVKLPRAEYELQVKSKMTVTNAPQWLNQDPKQQFKRLLEGGSRAILLYGAPRTGKTRAVDDYVGRDDASRETIQLHDGWGYDELMVGLRPLPSGQWEYAKGRLLSAIQDPQKKLIVLEEVNRTQATQALGEVFSLLEEAYRGKKYEMTLPGGERFYMPEDLTLVVTMNTLDQSTEEIDDALLGRFACIEFPPRVEDLLDVLSVNQVPQDIVDKLCELFAFIQPSYELGHGYFVKFTKTSNPIDVYVNNIRPVLQKHLANYADADLDNIDRKVDQLFGQP